MINTKLKKIFIITIFSLIIPFHASAFTLPTLPGVSGGDSGGFSLGDGKTELVDKFFASSNNYLNALALLNKALGKNVEAAQIVHSRFPNTIFQLAGYLDENPSGISLEELQSWVKQGDIQYLGEIKSVQSILKSCRYYVLPSYREGTPRSTLEALSTGRPVITTDVPGCRETVIHRKNGLLVIPKNSNSLAKAMISLIEEKDEKIQAMGKASYLIAKRKYQIEKVNKSILSIIGL